MIDKDDNDEDSGDYKRAPHPLPRHDKDGNEYYPDGDEEDEETDEEGEEVAYQLDSRGGLIEASTRRAEIGEPKEDQEVVPQSGEILMTAEGQLKDPRLYLERLPAGGKGAPTLQITDMARAFVCRAVSWGRPQDEIAACLGISTPSLRKYFERELAIAAMALEDAAAQKLCQKALKGNLGALIFLLSRRFGWKEVSKTEISGPDGSPVQLTAVDGPRQLNREEWEREIKNRRRREERKARKAQLVEEGLKLEYEDDITVDKTE